MKIVEKNSSFVISVALTALKLIGFWIPNKLSYLKTIIYYAHSLFIFALILGSYIIFQALDFYLVWGDLSLMTGTAFLLLTNCAQTIKIVNLMVRRRRIGDVISENDAVLSGERRIEGMEIVKRCNLEAKVLFFFYFSLTTFTLIGWANSAEKNQLPLRAWYPYDTQISPAFELTYLHQIGAIFIAAFINVAKDCLTSCLIAQVRCRLQLLNLSLRTLHQEIYVTDNTLLNKTQENLILKKLRDYVIDHQKSLKAASEIQECFSHAIFAQYFVSMVIICVTAFQLASQTGNLVRFISMGTYLLNMMFQVFLYCYQGDLLRDESIKIAEGAYQSTWYQSSLVYRRRLLVIMMRTQRPVVLKAGGFITLSLQSFMKLIKTSYSFFTVLQNVGEK